MKAQNLTISIPYKGCDKKCPYCISEMTGYIISDWNLMVRHIEKVKTLARAASVNSVLLTGKGEPFLDVEKLFYILNNFKKWPCEVQTNGIILNKQKNKLIPQLKDAGLNTVAFSIDTMDQFDEYQDLFADIKQAGMLSRAALILTDELPADINLPGLVELCKSHGIHQLLLKKINKPTSVSDDHKIAQWIKDNTQKGLYEKLVGEFEALKPKLRKIRMLPHGVSVWSIGGVSVSFSDYCIQEFSHEDDIRSLIFQEDGHLYTAWDDPASILF